MADADRAGGGQVEPVLGSIAYYAFYFNRISTSFPSRVKLRVSESNRQEAQTGA
jgi:hypothetical protein